MQKIMNKNYIHYKKNKGTNLKRKKIIFLSLITIMFLITAYITQSFIMVNFFQKNNDQLKMQIKNNDNEKLVSSSEKENSEIKKVDWQSANDDYFQDAIFIGDSRTEGFMLNNGIIATVQSYTQKGLTVDSIFTSKIINKNGQKLTIMEALKESSFSKVYLMLGINETGWPYNDVFISHYAKVIDEIKKINPNCIIYVQSIIPVTEKVSNSHPYVKNSKIMEFNSLIEKMADEKGVYYLNVAEALVNEDSVLPEDAASDGIHLNKNYCIKWYDYLKSHVVGE